MIRISRLWLILCIYLVKGDFPPNPQINFSACNRAKPSFVCNPDNVIPFEDAEKLDRLMLDVHRVSKCLCQQCSRESGITLGIFLAHDIRNRTVLPSSWNGNDLANWIREQWKLGVCDDDVVIVLIAGQNISGFSIGPELLRIFPKDAVQRILQDCAVHFRFQYYTQGLESVINSIGDVLMQIQKQRPQPVSSNFGLAIGVVLGVCVFLVLVLSAIIVLWRQTQMKHKAYRKEVFSNESRTRKDRDYHPCKLSDDAQNTESDEDSDTDVLYDSRTSCKDCTFLRMKRQLSDVQEEPEDNYKDDGETNVHRKCSTRSQEVTEL